MPSRLQASINISDASPAIFFSPDFASKFISHTLLGAIVTRFCMFASAGPVNSMICPQARGKK